MMPSLFALCSLALVLAATPLHDETRAFETAVLETAALETAALETAALETAALKFPPRKVSVFWLLGQSNAGGSTAGFWLANPLAPGNKWPQLSKQARLKIWWPGKTTARPQSAAGWETYVTGSINNDNNSSSQINENIFGPEAAIADAAIKHLSRDVYIFKFAGVGSLSPKTNVGCWSKRPGSIYLKAMAEWKLACTALLNRGLLPDVKAVFWVQGESDFSQAKAYEGLLKQFISDLRADVDSFIPRKYRRKLRRPYPLPIVVSELHDQHMTNAIWDPVEAVIRSAQAKVTQADPYAFLCKVAGLVVPQIPPGVHYDPVSDMLHGYRLFDALKLGLGPRLR